jgi:hypothetical protein
MRRSEPRIATVSTSSPNTIFMAHGSVSQTPSCASAAGVKVSAFLTQKLSATAMSPSAP